MDAVRVPGTVVRVDGASRCVHFYVSVARKQSVRINADDGEIELMHFATQAIGYLSERELRKQGGFSWSP